MLNDNALRQLTDDHRLHHEAEAEAQRLVVHARGRNRRSRRLLLAAEMERLRDAREHAGHVLLTVWPRR